MTTSVLNWELSAVATKSGTGIAAYFTDLKSVLDGEAANASFLWEAASIQTSAGLQYLVVKRKDGSPGRLLLLNWTTGAPAAPNPAIFTIAITANRLFAAWFPNGNVDTPSQLATGNTGTIMGDDTGCTYAGVSGEGSSPYSAGFAAFAISSQEIIIIGSRNSSAGSFNEVLGGLIFVDRDDNAANGVLLDSQVSSLGFLKSALTASASQQDSGLTWTASPSFGGATSNSASINDVFGKRAVGLAAMFSGAYASNNSSLENIHKDSSVSKVWFQPIPVLDFIKGRGWGYKLRQIAVGPPVTAPDDIITTVSLSPAAIAPSANGLQQSCWLTNFKV